jgi:hypothetical protein
MEYIGDICGEKRNIVELNTYFSKNSNTQVLGSWYTMNQKRFERIIECANSYNDLCSCKETRMDIIQERLPELYSDMDDEVKGNIEEICKTTKIDVLVGLLSKVEFIKKKKFNLHDINTTWEPNTVIELYRLGTVNLDYICQCFFFNASISSIQTINYNGSDREIQTISGNEDIIPFLDVYYNVFMSYNAPKIPNKHFLVVESLIGKPIDRIIKYIEDNGIVGVQDIKNIYNTMETDVGVTSIIRDLNDRCIDITYANKDVSRITHLINGDLVRCSIKANKNSMTISYMIFTGSLPENIKVAKHLRKYIGTPSYSL